MSRDVSHLNAIEERLFRARGRFSADPSGHHLREITRIEKEFYAEMDFLDGKVPTEIAALSDDDLLAELVQP
jgi:hypothetical protein